MRNCGSDRIVLHNNVLKGFDESIKVLPFFCRWKTANNVRSHAVFSNKCVNYNIRLNDILIIFFFFRVDF